MKPFWVAAVLAFVVVLILQGALAAAVISWLTTSPRERFRSAYFEFELSKGWNCVSEGTEFICKPSAPFEKQAIIIIAQKYRGPDDNESTYMSHLSKVRNYESKGTKIIPELKFVRHSHIGRFDWVDSLQSGAEVPNYFTRYLATTTSHLGILVTFSVHKDQYEAIVNDFETMIATLQVHQT